ncbi:C40 family peptidase [Pseudonocardia nantongensis]|uniref:C40 family peptidase n=1 Tax=Pseudonocardia nantongensis TaxID=1181885 RepID=UPI00397C5DAD
MPQRHTVPAVRVAVVATTAAAAAVLSVLPAAIAAPAPGAPAPAAPVTRDVAPAANVLPAASPAAAHPAAQNAAAAAGAASAAGQAAATRTSAMSTAMAQVGKPYSWGASGPSSFDCSGLISYAFEKAGKDVPRTSRAQASAGTEVSKSELRPGDLVFFYKPVSHVGIYVGGDRIVHASTSGEPVKVSDMASMPFNSARRV